MQAPLPISVTMPVKNAEKYLAQSLAALSGFAEVIVLDNGSSDATMEIAAGFANVRLHQSPFIGFGPLKNLAASLAEHDWILNIDSDEIVLPELAAEIAALTLDENTVYSLPRLNHYCGRPIRSCGWSPDYVLRLYHRGRVRYNDRRVHESLALPENTAIVRLRQELLHYSFDGVSELVEKKVQRYTDLFAEQQQFKQRTALLSAIGHGAAAFVKSYLFRGGWRDGATGWVISAAQAQGSYYKYVKLAEANRRLSVSLIISVLSGADALAAVLQSVLAQQTAPDEVLLACAECDARTDAVVEQYRPLIPSLKLLRQPEKDGSRAECLNRALLHSRCDYVLLADSETLLHPRFVADHKQVAKKGVLVQGAAGQLDQAATDAVLAQAANGSLSLPAWYRRGLTDAWHKRLRLCRIPLLAKLLIRRENRNLTGIRGCNMGFFREDAQRINGFNSDFVGWGREDSEFAARFFNAGGKRANLKFAAVAYHLWHHEASRQSLPENDRLLTQALEGSLTRCENGMDRFAAEAVQNEKGSLK